MKTRRLATPLGIAVLLCACGAAELRATTLMQMSVAQMARVAQDIVRARCIANATQWDSGELWTVTTFDVEERWQGAANGRITVRLLGGRTLQFTSIVSGVPHFRPGEDVILFLQRTPQGDYSVVSWRQGTFRIQRETKTGEEQVTQDTAQLQTYDPSTRRFVTGGSRKRTISEFRSEVEAALKNEQGPKQ
ncbi:MAG: hypothetical protein ACRD40_06295 [Candidatus Acidiferrales bacterium]